MKPGVLDVVFALVMIVGYPIWDHFWGWPAIRRSLASGRPGARTRFYASILRLEWSAALVIVALWLANGRAWTALALGLPGGWRFAIPAALVALGVAFLLARWRKIGALSAEKRAKLAPRLGEIGLILPRDAGERRWFAALSVTAGICEELLYRGYLPWALSPWLGTWGAAAASLAGFTLAHSYQGKGFVPRIGTVGLVFVLLAMGSGTIVWGIVLHAAMDLLGGETGYALLRESGPAGDSGQAANPPRHA